MRKKSSLENKEISTYEIRSFCRVYFQEMYDSACNGGSVLNESDFYENLFKKISERTGFEKGLVKHLHHNFHHWFFDSVNRSESPLKYFSGKIEGDLASIKLNPCLKKGFDPLIGNSFFFENKDFLLERAKRYLAGEVEYPRPTNKETINHSLEYS